MRKRKTTHKIFTENLTNFIWKIIQVLSSSWKADKIISENIMAVQISLLKKVFVIILGNIF